MLTRRRLHTVRWRRLCSLADSLTPVVDVGIVMLGTVLSKLSQHIGQPMVALLVQWTPDELAPLPSVWLADDGTLQIALTHMV